MTIFNDYNLLQKNSFKLFAIAKTFIEVDSTTDFIELSKKLQGITPLILGGGSNVLFVQNEIDCIISYTGNSITIVDENIDTITLKVEAGKNWHEFVLETLRNDWYGLENLALIPGLVGAAPVQNIGAYGKEVASFIKNVHVVELHSGIHTIISNSECHFDYRNSIFKKNEFKNKFLITSVELTLSKKPEASFAYPDVQSELSLLNIPNPTPIDIADAIIAIRTRKLPDPAVLGNAGSFFKNPVIASNLLSTLKQSYPNIPNYPIDDYSVKVPAGWLIEQCGWKGKIVNGAGVHINQALVLTNAENTTGTAILDLAYMIINSVKVTFGISLQPEVNIIGEG